MAHSLSYICHLTLWLLYVTIPSISAAATRGHRNARHGAVASEVSRCSEVGTLLLQEPNGNAADAIVGTVFCVGVIGMYHSGIAGGGFMLVRSSNGTYEFVDFRETAPKAARKDMFNKDQKLRSYGGLASGVPGEIRGLHYLHRKYGGLSWKKVLSPAIAIARDGFEVSEDLFTYMNSISNNSFLTEEPWATDFAPNGKLVKKGDKMFRKRYAKTLETIAEEGPDAFYKGAIANATIRALRAANGTMTLDDLANYTVTLRQPVSIQYRGYKLTSTNAPSSGIVALSVLNTMSGYDKGDSGNDKNRTHILDEAIRFGYGQRSKLGDPSFVDSMDNYTKNMISPENGETIRSKISDSMTHQASYYDPNGLESIDTPGTSHVVAADDSGLTISLTTTINLLFGSRIMVNETGVIMNNEMHDFSIPSTNKALGEKPNPANFIHPGKRPLSAISPINYQVKSLKSIVR